MALKPAVYNPRIAPSVYDRGYVGPEFQGVALAIRSVPTVTNLGNSVFNVLDGVFKPFQDGTLDISPAVIRATAAAVAAGGGTVFFPAMAAHIGDVPLVSNVDFVGAGWGTILKKMPAAQYMFSANAVTGGTPDPADNLSNWSLSRMQLIGNAVTGGFNEFKYAVNLNAVSDGLVEWMKIVAFEGDGIYLGSSNVAGVERHNERITIRHIVLDGVNKQNRNGISIIDATDLDMHDIYITRCSAPGMPGGIDIEPNADAFARLRNIRIWNIVGEDIGGNGGVISVGFSQPQSFYTIPPSGITIDHVAIRGCVNALLLLQLADSSDASTPLSVSVTDYHAQDGTGAPLLVEGIKGFTVTDSSMTNFVKSPQVGLSYRCQDIALAVDWTTVGAGLGTGLRIGNVDRIDQAGSSFVDCGPVIGGGTALTFETGTSSFVWLRDVTFRSPLGYMAHSVVNGGHTYTPATNRNQDNIYLDSVDVGAGQFFPYPPGTPSVDRGDASVTLVMGVDAEVQRFATNLTANRTAKLPLAGQNVGDHFRVLRNEPVASAHTLALTDSTGGTTYGTLPNGHNGTMDATWDGSAWQLTGIGVL